MIKIPALLLVPVAAGWSGLCPSVADEEASLPLLRLELKRMALRVEDKKDTRNPAWKMELRWLMSEVPGWEIYCCEDEPPRITLEDSTGRKTAGVECVSLSIDRRMGGCMRPRGWMPAAGARWVKVQGEIPFVVSRREAVTAPMAVKLIQGASAPLVLKGAGLGQDGRAEDVNAKLVVSEYRDAQSYESEGRKNKKMLGLRVEADVPVGIRDFVLQSADGTPVAARDFHQRMIELLGIESMADMRLSLWNGKWPVKTKGWGEGAVSGTWEISPVPEGELLVSVRYSQNLQRCRAVVDGKASLTGFLSEGEGKTAGHDGKSPGMKSSPRDAGGIPLPAASVRGGKGKPPVTARLTSLTIGSGNEWQDGAEPVQMKFEMELLAKAPSVFGDGAEIKEQSLSVTDSTGRVLSPAIFNLEWLDTGDHHGKGAAPISIRGSSLEPASSGAEWLHLRGTLRVPLAILRESAVYELPLLEGAELQIPLPGMEDAGGNGSDVAAAGDAPSGRLKLEEVQHMEEEGTRAESGIKVELSLTVKDFPFGLDCFELVDDQGVPLKKAEFFGNGRSRSFDAQGRETERSWSQKFKIGCAADLKNLHVRLKYKADAETVEVPVDGRIGLGGSEGWENSVKRP